MVVHNGTMLLCGGKNNEQNCLQLDKGTWKVHSNLNEMRKRHSAVKTEAATFVFGGRSSETTYEYLPKDSTTWLMGKTNIPGGFRYGCAIAVKSEQEIWLIGGLWTEQRILSFDVNNHFFQVLPSQLNLGRYELRCAFSVAILAEISYFARNLTYNADENFSSIGRRNFVQNARYFTLAKLSPKSAEISPKTDENGRILTSYQSKFFFNFL